jgi:hypothetical protein
LCGSIKYEIHAQLDEAFVGSKAPWFEISHSLPRYQEGPPR